MEKQNFNGKNEEPFIPEGLEYRDEHWRKALDGIIRQEKRKDRQRLAWIFSALALILVVGTYAVATYFAAPDQTIKSNQQNGSGISAIPETKSSKETNASQETELKIEIPSNSIPAKSALKEEEKVKTFASSANEVKVLLNGNQKRKDHLDDQKAEAATSVEQFQTLVYENKSEVIVEPAIVAPEMPVGQQNFSRTQTVLPFSDVAAVVAWDRQYRITPISKLQLPAMQEELRTPNALKSDRNWIEPTWRLWAFAGTSLVTDFSSPLRDIRIDPMAGLRVEYNFNKRFFVDGGVEYFAISNVRRPYSQTSIAYDLSYQRTVTTIETHQLHYLSIPLHVGYRIAQRHHVSLGLGVSYMITGTNEIFQYKQTPTSNTLINHYDDNGFVAGFKDFPVHTELGYTFKLGRNKSIRCAYQFGLTDITKNDYFQSSSFDRNSRLLIDLSFKLKSK